MRKILVACMLVLAAVPAFADNKPVSPPIATHLEYVTEMVPMRVWVLPGSVEGVSFEGHYEYFSMPMLSNEPKPVMDGLPQEPAIMAAPQQDIGTQPAITQP